MAETRNPITRAVFSEIIPGPLGRSRTTSVSGRVVKADAAKFRVLAAKLGRTPGELVRELVRLSVTGDPAEALRQVATLLELPDDAQPAEVLAEIKRLVDFIAADPNAESPAPAGDEAMGDTATTTPPAKPMGLSVAQAAALKRRGLPLTVAAWNQLTSSVARGDRPTAAHPAGAAPPTVEVLRPLTAAEIAFGDRHNIPRAELRSHLAAKRAGAVRLQAPAEKATK